MTGEEIINRFHLQVDDESELSDDEELALLNEVYGDIQDDRPWEWLKMPFTGNSSTSVPYVSLPSDFKLISPNSEGESVVFVGTTFQPYKVVPFSNRRAYRNMDGYCYIDIVNRQLVFTLQPTTSQPVEFDYIRIAPDLTLTTSPLFTTKHEVISYGMAVKFAPIEQGEKGFSYMGENKVLFNDTLADLAYEDANQKLNT